MISFPKAPPRQKQLLMLMLMLLRLRDIKSRFCKGLNKAIKRKQQQQDRQQQQGRDEGSNKPCLSEARWRRARVREGPEGRRSRLWWTNSQQASI